jgi:hypothetical protein
MFMRPAKHPLASRLYEQRMESCLANSKALLIDSKLLVSEARLQVQQNRYLRSITKELIARSRMLRRG